MVAAAPAAVAAELRRIASRIDASRNPSLELVTAALRKVLASVQDDLPDFWVTREEIAAVCPPCAERMAALRIKEVRASAIFGQDMLALAAERTADKWKGMPGGWDAKSRKKFWESVGGSVTKCVEKMEGKVDDAGAFCASLKDRVEKSTEWRGPHEG